MIHLHLTSTLGILSTLSGIGTFLYGCYHQLKRAVDAVVAVKASIIKKINEHDEVYGWYATYVKPKRKTNGLMQ